MAKTRKHQTPYRHNIIGMVYDFDGTLSPNNMQEDTIFREWGIDKKEFWDKSDALTRQGYERTLAYLSLLIHDKAFQKKPLTRKVLHRLASQVEYFQGVTTFFAALDRYLKSLPEVREWGIQIEHYIISSGMKEILEACSIAKHFKEIYACEYDYGAKDKGPVFPKLVINDTNKTQFLFRINKGRLAMHEDINDHMPDADRRIPFQHMIYMGDSLTDIPSMTVTSRYGGHSIAVFDPKVPVPEKVKRIVMDRRVSHFAPADFRANSLLMKIVQKTLSKIVHEMAYGASSAMSYAWVSDQSKRASKSRSA